VTLLVGSSTAATVLHPTENCYILFFVGIAGGIKDVAIGDVVAATDVYGYESVKIGEQVFTRPKLGKSAHALVQRARSEARKGGWLQRLASSPASQPRVFVAPIAAGEKVIASKQSDIFNFIRASYNDAIAVEMEGFGFLSAAFAYPNIKAIVIRGISDLIEGKNDDSIEPEQIRQEKVSHHASAFAFEMLAKLQGEESNPMLLSQDNNPSQVTEQKALAYDDIRDNQNTQFYQRLKDMHQDDSVDVVIVTALEKERDAVLRYLDSPQRVESKNRVVYKSYLQHEDSNSRYRVLLFCLGGMGNVQAATAVTQAIDVWNPAAIILTGIMGGVEASERLLGDLIVAEQIVGYESGKAKDTGTERRFEVLRSSHLLIEKARHFPPEKWAFQPKILRPDGSSGRVIPKAHLGIVASGEKVIADTITVPELQSSWVKLIGVEMEGFGTALAVYQSGSAPAMLMVKGICDWADPNKNDEWQAYAADVAAAYVVNFLKSNPIEARANNQAQPKLLPSFSGKAKIQLCRRLSKDWSDLADYFDIPEHHRRRFRQGYECQEIWEWLRERDQLYSLRSALNFIERQDLIDILDN